jgi:hypothetical protein
VKADKPSGAAPPAHKFDPDAVRHNELSVCGLELRTRKGESGIGRRPPQAAKEDVPCRSFIHAVVGWMLTSE